MIGQIEVGLISGLISKLQEFSHGKRLGILTGDTLTDRKSVKFYTENLKLNFDQVSFVHNLDEWKAQFLKLQKSVDLLVLRNNAGVRSFRACWANASPSGERPAARHFRSAMTPLSNFTIRSPSVPGYCRVMRRSISSAFLRSRAFRASVR